MPASLSSRTVTIDDLNNFRWPLNLTENAIRVSPTFATVIALAVALAIGTFLTILFVLLTGGPGEDPNAKLDENGYGPGILYILIIQVLGRVISTSGTLGMKCGLNLEA